MLLTILTGQYLVIFVVTIISTRNMNPQSTIVTVNPRYVNIIQGFIYRGVRGKLAPLKP